jgi:hypothetical protein
MTSARQGPPREIHFVGSSGVVQEDPQAQKLCPYRCPLYSFDLCRQNLGQAAFESLTRQHRSGPWPKTGGLRRWSLEQVDRSVEDLSRGELAHGSCTNPRASLSLSSTRFKSASRAIGL